MKRSFVVLALAAFLCAGSLGRAESDGTPEAIAAATAWLGIVDAGDYAKSWDEAAAIFRTRVTKTEWQKAVGSVRDQTGAMKTRELESTKAERQLPGVPDGDYVVLRYRSSFDKYPSATETVATTRDADGHWRVGGYFVR